MSSSAFLITQTKPTAGRFVQPGDVRGWDWYAYVQGNPLRYTDPSGHFTEEAIRQYLLEYYGDEELALRTLQLWKQDQEWWEMIRLAEGGSVVFGMSGRLNTDGIPQLGYQRMEEEVGYEVVGLINFEDGWPFFWHEGYERTERLNPKADLKDGMYKTRILAVWWGAVTFSGYLSTSFGVLLALVDNPIVNTQGFVFDVLDIEDGDVNVSVGTCYFNFQQQFPYGNYKMELR